MSFIRKKYISLKIVFVAMIASMGIGASGNSEETDETKREQDLTMREDSSLSGAQQLEQVESKTLECREIIVSLQRNLDRALKERDTLKSTCLDDKLTQARASMMGIEERTVALRGDIRAGRSKEANQNFSILKIYIARIFELKAEAENCLGEFDVSFGNTATTVTGGETLPSDVFSSYTPEVVVDPPEHASGFF